MDVGEYAVALFSIGLSEIGRDVRFGDIQTATVYNERFCGFALQFEPECARLVGQPGVEWVEIIVSDGSRVTERGGFRIAYTRLLDNGDVVAQGRGGVGGHESHDATADYHQVLYAFVQLSWLLVYSSSCISGFCPMTGNE